MLILQLNEVIELRPLDMLKRINFGIGHKVNIQKLIWVFTEVK